MTTLAEARDGLEAVLGTIPGLRVFDYVPSDPSPPVAVILPPVIPNYGADLADVSIEVRFPVLLLVASNVDRQQLDLYELVEKSGARSVFAAIAADKKLGGLNVTARATGVEDFDTERFGLISYFGRVVNVTVFVTGS